MADQINTGLTALSSVANNLIDKISSAIGWSVTHDTPSRIAVKTYIEEIEQSNLPSLQKAAFIRRAKKDIREYANQCKIVSGAVAYLQDTAEPEKMDNDWIAQFFDKARLVSDEEVQLFWSKLLADECNIPGSIPKSLMFVLEKMGREDAEDFLKLCSVAVSAYNETAPLIIDEKNEVLEAIGLNYDKLINQESLGLIKMSGGFLSSSYALTPDVSDEEKSLTYFDHCYKLPSDWDSFPVGNVLFTKDGVALYKVVTATEREGFWENTVIPWIENHLKETKPQS